MADEIKATGELKSSISKYQTTLGVEKHNYVKIQPLEIKPEIFGNIQALILNGNFSVKSQKLTTSALREDLKAIKKEIWPSLSATGTFSKAYEGTNRDSKTTTASALLNLSVPIYDGNTNSSQRRDALYKIRENQQKLEKIKREEIESLKSTYELYKSSIARIEAIKDEIKASEIALNAIKKEAEVGTKSLVDILDAEKELFNARISLIDEQELLLSHSYAIGAASGSLVPEHLKIYQATNKETSSPISNLSVSPSPYNSSQPPVDKSTPNDTSKIARSNLDGTVDKIDGSQARLTLPLQVLDDGKVLRRRFLSTDGRYIEEDALWTGTENNPVTAGMLLSESRAGPPVTDATDPTEIVEHWEVFRGKERTFDDLVGTTNILGPAYWRRAQTASKDCVVFLQRWTKNRPDGPISSLSGYYCAASGDTLTPGEAETIVQSVGIIDSQ